MSPSFPKNTPPSQSPPTADAEEDSAMKDFAFPYFCRMNKKFQVFVSSTYTDLIEERQVCVEAILHAGHIPAGMELFSAGSESQLETIKRWIADSDIYMLLLGGRYGSIEPISGLSYTEVEYNYALELNKPFFAIVIDPDYLRAKVKLKGIDVAETAYGEKYEAFKKKVLSKTSSFFKNSDNLKVHVLTSLKNIEQRPDLLGWVREIANLATQNLLLQIQTLSEKNITLQRQIEGQPNPSSNERYNELIEKQNKLAEEQLNIEKRKRLSEIQPEFILTGAQAAQSSFTLVLRNDGNDAQNMRLVYVNTSFVIFSEIPLKAKRGAIIEINGWADQSRTFLNGYSVTFEANLEYEDKDGNKYEQNIRKLGNSKYTIGSPMLQIQAIPLS